MSPSGQSASSASAAAFATGPIVAAGLAARAAAWTTQFIRTRGGLTPRSMDASPAASSAASPWSSVESAMPRWRPAVMKAEYGMPLPSSSDAKVRWAWAIASASRSQCSTASAQVSVAGEASAAGTRSRRSMSRFR